MPEDIFLDTNFQASRNGEKELRCDLTDLLSNSLLQEK